MLPSMQSFTDELVKLGAARTIPPGVIDALMRLMRGAPKQAKGLHKGLSDVERRAWLKHKTKAA